MVNSLAKYTKLAAYAKPYKTTVIVMVASVLVLTALRVYIPILLGNAVGNIVGNNGEANQILLISLEIIGISALSSVFQYSLGYGGQVLGQKIVYDMRNKLFSSIQSQSFAFHDRNETGQLMARATGDVEAIRRLFAFGSAQILGNLVLLVGVVFALFLLNVNLAVIVALPLPLIGYVSWRYAQTQSPHWKRSRDHYGAMNSILQQNILGLRVVRSSSAEEQEIRKFEKAHNAYRDDIIGVAAVRSFYSPLLILILNFALAAIYVVGGFQVIGGTMAIGAIVAAVNLIALLTGPVRFLGQLILLVQNGIAGFDRLLEITEASNDIEDRPDALELDRSKVRGSIEFEEVTFGYTQGGPALRNVNLKIRPGETVAFVGATGSGKTTAANLIPRFYDPTSGRVVIDGIDVRNLKLRWLRSNVGIVSQDIFLFSATIRENIAYGMPETPTSQIEGAAKVAHADEFIERFREKYDTLVGERGVTLSGGQKQRVAIARTLITNPQILILDDSLSSVDVETEHAIQDSLKAVIFGRTSIIITQRVSTLRLADRIVVFNQGKIAEEGTHSELLMKGGLYAELYNSQLGESPQEEEKAATLRVATPSKSAPQKKESRGGD